LQLILKSDDTVIGFNTQGIKAIRRDLPVSANAWVNIGMRRSSIEGCQRFSAACTRIDQLACLQVADNIVINVDMPALVINFAVPIQAESFERF